MDAESASVAVALLVYVGLPELVLFVGWFVGHLSETRHEQSLAEREEALRDIEATDMRNPPGFAAAEGPCMLVSGEAVVASDTFKSWVFGLKNIVGGESKFFTRLFALGYDRYLTIEREITGPQQREDILKAKRYIERFLAEREK